MKITAKLDYTCRILCELAREYSKGNPVRIEQLSKAEGVPANFLAQILGELRNGKLVISRRGTQGGFLLARPPVEITFLEIIEAVEGGLLEFNGNTGGRSSRRIKQIWDEVREAAAEKARSYTLDVIAAKVDAEMYYI